MSVRSQKYATVKRQILKSKRLYEDADFPPTLLLEHCLSGRVEWKRPTDLCSNPKLVNGRLNSSNISQGKLGNCWFVAACCCLAKEKSLWDKASTSDKNTAMVVPHHESQDYKEEPLKQGGMFYFRFWQFGKWIDIMIDDRLPTINGKLIFAHSKTKNEFWCALIEKAYAKLHGSYIAIKGGNLVDALVDFTAGFAERLNIDEERVRLEEKKRRNLFDHLKEEKRHHSLMCCAITTGSNTVDGRLENGLVVGHAYCITDVRTIDIKREKLSDFFKEREHMNMIRVRNPWGEVEWNGTFSDRSPEWKRITSKDKGRCQLSLEDDGEFWMTFEDFCTHFTEISFCYLVNTSWFSLGHAWSEWMCYGQWVTGAKGTALDRAGGCSNYRDSFYRNPQYLLNAIHRDQLLVMLQQKETRGKIDSPLFSIGVTMWKVELNRKYRMGRSTALEKASASKFMESRNVFLKCDLEPGRYVIMPSTFRPNLSTDYLLRVFAKNSLDIEEMHLNGPKPPRFRFQQPYRFVTRVTIREGVDLKMPNAGDSTFNPYFILMCEKNKVKGPVKEKTNHPQWMESAIFYLKNPKSHLRIQVWNKQKILDVIIGQVTLPIPKTDVLQANRVGLRSVDKKLANLAIGEIIIEMASSKSLASF